MTLHFAFAEFSERDLQPSAGARLDQIAHLLVGQRCFARQKIQPGAGIRVAAADRRLQRRVVSGKGAIHCLHVGKADAERRGYLFVHRLRGQLSVPLGEPRAQPAQVEKQRLSAPKLVPPRTIDQLRST